MSRRLRLLAVMLAALTFLAAACDSDSDDDAEDTGETTEAVDDTTTTSEAGAPADGAVVLEAAEAGELGAVLRDGEGFTLYAFTDDEEGVSNCSGGCAELWPPHAVEGAETPVGEGVDESLVGTITRDDGSTQVTYAGQPLYRYTPDAAPGDTNGQGVGGKWFQVKVDGTLAR